MDDKPPTYEELQARLAQAESTLDAICSDSVDAVIGQKGAYLLRLNEMEKARKQMEQALQESEQRFRALFEHSPNAVLFTSADGTIEAANPAACVMFGYGEQEFRNMGRSGILDEDPRLAAALKEWREAGRVKAVELTAIRKGGEKFPVEFDSVILPVEPVRSFMILRDVSERKQAEVVIRKSFERLRLASNAARLGVFDWDIPSDTPVWENPRIYEIFGHAPHDRPVNLNQLVREVLHPDDLARFEKELAACMRTGSLFAGNYRIRRINDGQWRWIAYYGQFKYNGGEAIRLVGAVEDITERKQAEAALHRSHQELEEYNYALTHNIKAPFRAVKNYASFLLEDLADTLEGLPRQYLEGIKNAVGLANRQFEDLEALYGVKDRPLDYENLDMGQLLGEIKALHEAMPECELIAATQWPMLWGERFLLRQILMALVSNGFKYNQSSAKRVEVFWQLSSDQRFEIVVRDNGIGIDPRYHDQIIRIFQRLHTDSEYEGTGIGLAIVNRAAQRIDGDLRIESAVGKGSSFVISLPSAVVLK